MNEEFNLESFRKEIENLKVILEKDTSEDPEYQGEVDDVITSIKFLCEEFKDKRYETVLPHLIKFFQYMDEMNRLDEEDDFDCEFEDCEEEEEVEATSCCNKVHN